MFVQTILNLGLYLLFVALGYWISGKMTPPQTTKAWILWVILVIFTGGVCVGGYAVNINDAVILRTNDMLQAIGMGILIGFVISKSKLAKQTTI
jgi:hypothetical protein